MHLIAILTDFRIQDVLDVAFLSVVTYHLYRWFEGTKALKALVGLAALGVVYTAARSWGFFLTTWVFQVFWQVLIILLVILFQSEIRQVLERVNPFHALGLRRGGRSEEWIRDFTQGILRMARRKIGALIVIERTDNVAELITRGQPLASEPTPEILLSIFHKESPIHDGAVLIREGRICEVACYLPLSSDEDLPKEWGTRHRAALGLAQRSDAWVVVVSEERGKVSMAKGGQVIPVNTVETLAGLLQEAVAPTRLPREKLGARIRFMLLNRWRLKLGTVFAITLIWLMLAGQQDFEATISVPLETTNIPDKMEIMEPLNPTVRVTVQGPRKDASTLDEGTVGASVDVALARFGRRTYAMSRENITLPNDRVHVVKIDPPQIKFTFKEKP